MKNGLILEGGGLRSLFSAGICDSWLEEDIHFDAIIGVSGGALFGCNFKSHQYGRALRYNTRFKDDPRYMGLRTFLKTGNIIGTEFAYHILPFELDPIDNEAFTNDPAEFYVVVTDVKTGLPAYHRIDTFDHESCEWMRATGSMPLVSQPVHLDGHIYLDGGMSDSIPLKKSQEMGFGRNVVILTRPRGYKKTPSKIIWAFKLFCRKYPKIAECMARRYDEYNKQVEYMLEQEKAGNALLIFPDEALQIGRTELNEDKMNRVTQIGRDKGKEMEEKVKDFLSH